MKDVQEIRFFARKLVNDGKGVVRDGVKDIGGLLSKLIGLIKPGTDAFADAKQYSTQLSAATNAQMDASQASLKGMLTNFTPERQRDIEAIEEGVVAITRIVAASRKEGVAEGRAEVFAEMKATGVDFAEFGITVD